MISPAEQITSVFRTANIAINTTFKREDSFSIVTHPVLIYGYEEMVHLRENERSEQFHWFVDPV